MATFRINGVVLSFWLLVLVLVLVLGSPASAGTACDENGVWLQVLGSGGPELDDGRASSSYLVWSEGRAVVLIDLGTGGLQQFEAAGARIQDLDTILLTHLHVDHSAELPALLKGSFFTPRRRDLPLYGPTGNVFMPDTTVFIERLFDRDDGAYRYLGDYLSGEAAYRLTPHDIPAARGEARKVIDRQGLAVRSVAVHHGPVPALAWRIDIAGHSVVISGDMNGDYHSLAGLATSADLLVAHHAVAEGATGVARNLHMPPSIIGEIAEDAAVDRLVLSHRMNRTLGRESESLKYIRESYQGEVALADDGDCFRF